MNTLTYLGHSGWILKTSGGRVLLIDPWLSGNPLAPLKIEQLPKADAVLLTHDHADHAGDAVAVVAQTGGKLIAQPETIARYQAAGVPKDRALDMNIGGTVNVAGVRITMVDALHTSETGEPGGYIITTEDGRVLYHAGDTGLNANMSNWGALFAIDLALLPIGDHYTMDGRQAAHALRLLGAKQAIPIHYRTFPLLAQSADAFIEHAREQAPSVKITVVDPGGAFRF
ncbi:MAG TPA: metal-dependent hydrolase [Limnochordia bacterium]|nr:metal-dependent hydrolase [Limnochordia bacterium]